MQNHDNSNNFPWVPSCNTSKKQPYPCPSSPGPQLGDLTQALFPTRP